MKMPIKMKNPFTGKKLTAGDIVPLALGAGALWLLTDIGKKVFGVAKPLTDKFNPGAIVSKVQTARTPQAPTANNVPRSV